MIAPDAPMLATFSRRRSLLRLSSRTPMLRNGRVAMTLRNDLLDLAASGDEEAIGRLASGDRLDRRALAAALFLKAAEGSSDLSIAMQGRAIGLLDVLADDGCEESGAILALTPTVLGYDAWTRARQYAAEHFGR
jgi:hypothetical protein